MRKQEICITKLCQRHKTCTVNDGLGKLTLSKVLKTPFPFVTETPFLFCYIRKLTFNIYIDFNIS